MFFGGFPLAALLKGGVPSWVPVASLGYREFTTDRAYMGGLVLASSTSAMSIVRTTAVAYDLPAITQFAANTFRRTSAGLLLEASETDYLDQTEAFTTTPWIDYNNQAIITAPAGLLGPNGQQAFRVDARNTSQLTGDYQSIPSGFSAGDYFRFTCFLKHPGIADANVSLLAWTNASNTGPTVAVTPSSSWGRFSLTGQITGSGNGNINIGSADQAFLSVPSSRGIFDVAQANLVRSSTSIPAISSYIPATTNSVARNADTVTDTVPNGATSALRKYSDASSATTTGLTPGASWTLPVNPAGTTLVSLDYRP